MATTQSSEPSGKKAGEWPAREGGLSHLGHSGAKITFSYVPYKVWTNSSVPGRPCPYLELCSEASMASPLNIPTVPGTGLSSVQGPQQRVPVRRGSVLAPVQAGPCSGGFRVRRWEEQLGGRPVPGPRYPRPMHPSNCTIRSFSAIPTGAVNASALLLTPPASPPFFSFQPIETDFLCYSEAFIPEPQGQQLPACLAAPSIMGD